MLSDSELVIQSQKGIQDAFRQIVNRHQQSVRGIVIGMLGDTPEAEEIAQDVFIRFYKAINQYKGTAKLSTYLGRIAINLSLNELKRRKRRQKRIVSLFGNRDLTNKIMDRPDDAGFDDNNDLIQMAIQSLEPEFRSVVVMRLVEGFSVKETADILKLPVGTVASRLARAQKKLQEILKPLIQQNG